MIIKSLSRKGRGKNHSAGAAAGGVIRYILRYALNPDKQNIKKGTFLIKHNLKGKTIKDFITEFKENHEYRLVKRSNQAVIHHIILSWSNKDSHKITNAMLLDMANHFISLRFPNALVIGTKHEDKSHRHLHLAVSSANVDFTSHRQNKADFAKLKSDMSIYQQGNYPTLVNSLPAHGKARQKIISKFQELDSLKTIRHRSVIRQNELIRQRF
jgi:hypothetical protein